LSLEGKDTRHHPRVPLVMEVGFRSTGSFLVSYSLNLSKGGFFLETDEKVPVGTRMTVRFTIPGADAPVESSATVAWTQPANDKTHALAGLGLKFEELEQSIGGRIDTLVRGFTGVTMLAVAEDTPSMERLSQYLKNILTCKVVLETAREVSEVGFIEAPDLVLIDLDSAGPEGLAVLSASERTVPPVPVVAIARHPRARTEATQRNIAGVLDNPPVFNKLRKAVLAALARPTAR